MPHPPGRSSYYHDCKEVNHVKLRKILSLALALTMMLALLPTLSLAQEEVTDQYRITD